MSLKDKIKSKAIEPIRDKISIARNYIELSKAYRDITRRHDALLTIAEAGEIVKDQSPTPRADFVASDRPDIMLPRLPYNLSFFFRMVWASPILRTIHTKIKQEAFRETKKDGWEWVPKFKIKCTECTAEYQEEFEECVFCKNTEFKKPDVTQQKLFEKWERHANDAGQSFIEVFEELEDDLNTTDDCYLVFSKEYLTYGDTIQGKVVELMRGDPCRFRIVADPSGRRGGYLWVCVYHRDNPQNEPGRCRKPHCDLRLEPVYYVETESGGKKALNYYIKGEVVHASKFSPSKLYGISPIFSLWVVARTSYLIDRLNQDYYEKGRPKGILAITGVNYQNFKKWWDKEQMEFRKDPHYFAKIVAETEDQKAQIEFINLIGSLKDMEMTETRKAMRDIMCALYGVSVIFMSDTSTAGGLNNEGLQITVTDRAIDASQAIHHNRLFPPVLEQLGITDWKLKLRPSREADKMAELQRFHQRVMTMKEMVSAGFDATMHEDMDGEIRFEFSGEASRQEYQPFGGYGQDSDQGQDRNQQPQDQESPEKPEPDNRLGEKNCPPGMISTPDNPKCHPIEEESKTKSETPLEEMTYDECVIKMKQEEDVMDPQALCGWIQKNLPGRIIKESKRELQQQTDKIETAFLRNLNKLFDKELLSELGKLKGASQKVINKKVDELIRKLKPNMEKGAFAEVIMAYQKGKSQAKQVLEKANMPKEMYLIEGADHNDVQFIEPQKYWDKISDWLGGLP